MEIIITFGLRLMELSSATSLVNTKAHLLLLQAREICFRWTTVLRKETFETIESAASKRCQQYTLWAALLCKRTFKPSSTLPYTLDPAALQTFIQCSIVAQHCLVSKISDLPVQLQHALVKDVRLSYHLRSQVLDLILENPSSFSAAIEDPWPEAEGGTRQLLMVKRERDPWISCLAKSGDEDEQQRVAYNVVEGILLVDECPVGNLPKDSKKSVHLQELFGNQALLTFPSSRKGMQYSECQSL